jgi:Fe-Mn family superoxide dismutase
MYQEQKFDLHGLAGLSERQISEHLGLYAGYVKNVNEILGSGQELTRRIGFEFNGMRLHELYFGSLSASPRKLTSQGQLENALAARFGGYETWLADFKKVGATRGTGWVLLVHDAKAQKLHDLWVQSHEIGHLGGTDILIALDMWEHAYLFDYLPSEKGRYIDAFFSNLDWSKVEERFITK